MRYTVPCRSCEFWKLTQTLLARQGSCTPMALLPSRFPPATTVRSRVAGKAFSTRVPFWNARARFSSPFRIQGDLQLLSQMLCVRASQYRDAWDASTTFVDDRVEGFVEGASRLGIGEIASTYHQRSKMTTQPRLP